MKNIHYDYMDHKIIALKLVHASQNKLTNPSRMFLHDDSKRSHLFKDDEVNHGCVIGNKHLKTTVLTFQIIKTTTV